MVSELLMENGVVKRISLLLLLVSSAAVARAQTSIDPNVQIRWQRASGSGAPTSICPSVAITVGTPYSDVTNNAFYVCANSGWFTIKAGGGPPGGSTGALQFNSNGAFGAITGSSVDSLFNVTFPNGVTANLFNGPGTGLTGTAAGLSVGGTAVGLSGSQTANFFYAAPNGSTGTGAWRAIVPGDIPTLNQNTTGSAGGLSGGSIGAIHYQSAPNVSAFLAGNTAATDQVLVSHGTGSAAQAPTLSNAPALAGTNFNGTANSLTSGNSNQLQSATWASPAGIGSTTPNTGQFTTSTGQHIGSANTCYGQTYAVATAVTQYGLVNLGTSGASPSGTGGGPVRGVAQASVSSGNVNVCFNGQSSVVMDGTAVAGNIAIPSTTTGGQAHDSGQTSSNNIAITTGDLGLIVTGCSGSPCTATVALKGADQFGRQSGGTPAGSNLNLQFNNAGVFGGASGISTDPTMQQNLFVNGSTTTYGLPGYRQNQYGAASVNRDGALEKDLRPQDMPGCANSGSGLIDDTPCINQAMLYLSGYDNNVTKKLVLPKTQNGYQLVSTPYQVTLPYDYGDFHGFAGYISQGAVGLQFINGVLASCTVTGGSGYAPSANLQVLISDPSFNGSGATATVQTNSSGTPTGCTVTNGGGNYPPIGVNALLIPLGGAGAAGTCALVSGTFTSPCTVSAAGSGYATGVPAGLPGLTCGTNPVLTATVTGAGISAVTTTAGAGCTYSSSSTATVPIAFGASCGGSQCTLLTPETPINMPCAVQVIAGVTIEGIGNPTISTGWGNVSSPVNTSQSIAFCDPSGTQATGLTFRNISVQAFIGWYFPLVANHVLWDHVTFTGGLLTYTYSFGGTWSYANGQMQHPRSRIQDSLIQAWVPGLACGLAWAGRNPTTNSGSSEQTLNMAFQGGSLAFNLANYANPLFGGRCSGIDVTPGSTFFDTSANQTNRNLIDSFVEQYLWKTQDGPASPYTDGTHSLSNGTTAGCVITQSVTDRTTDYKFGYNSINAATYPYYQCFPGITSAFETFYPRYSSNDTQGSGSSSVVPPQKIDGVILRGTARAIINGRFDSVMATNITQNTCGQSNYTDPYKQTGQTNSAFNITSQVNTKSQFANYIQACGTGGFVTGVQALTFGKTSTSNTTYAQNVLGATDNVGSITGVTAGTGLTGGGTSGSVTLNLSTPVPIANGGTGSATANLTAGSGIGITGTWPNQTIACSGGLTAGTNITITGSCPSQTINATAAGTITGVTAGTGLNGGGTSGTVTVNCSNATTSATGCVQPDGSSITISGGVISSTNSGGNVSSSGSFTVGDMMVANNTSGTSVVDGGAHPRPFPTVTMTATGGFPPALVEWVYPNSSAFPNMANCTSAANTTVGASTTQPQMVKGTSGAVSGDCAGFYNNGSANYNGARVPKIVGGIGYTASTDFTSSARIWFGLVAQACSQATFIASDTPACTYGAIRSSTSASDPTYECVSDSGSGTPQVQSIGVAPTTAYTVVSVQINNGTSVVCTVGGTSVTNSTKVPAASTNFYDLWTNTTLTTAATHLLMSNFMGVSLAGTY